MEKVVYSFPGQYSPETSQNPQKVPEEGISPDLENAPKFSKNLGIPKCEKSPNSWVIWGLFRNRASLSQEMDYGSTKNVFVHAFPKSPNNPDCWGFLML